MTRTPTLMVWTINDEVIERPEILASQFEELRLAGFGGVAPYVRCSRYHWNDPPARKAFRAIDRLCKRHGMEFWLGALPPMPRNLELTFALGGERPRDCLILPVTLRQKTVCFIYGDNLGDGVGGVPVSAMRRLAAKAGLAFQVYLMKGKIRTL